MDMELRHNSRRISKATCAIDGSYAMLSKKLGIKGNLLWLLYALDDGDLHSQKQICQEWLFPKTTINTLTKECQAEGYVTLHTIPGRKRELHVRITEKGRQYTRRMLWAVYAAEDEALERTLQTCPPEFISYLETYTQNLKHAFEKYAERKEIL